MQARPRRPNHAPSLRAMGGRASAVLGKSQRCYDVTEHTRCPSRLPRPSLGPLAAGVTDESAGRRTSLIIISTHAAVVCVVAAWPNGPSQSTYTLGLTGAGKRTGWQAPPRMIPSPLFSSGSVPFPITSTAWSSAPRATLPATLPIPFGTLLPSPPPMTPSPLAGRIGTTCQPNHTKEPPGKGGCRDLCPRCRRFFARDALILNTRAILDPTPSCPPLRSEAVMPLSV